MSDLDTLTELQETYSVRPVFIGQLSPQFHYEEKEGGPSVAVIDSVQIGGNSFAASPRFMQSFWTRFGLSPSTLTMFDPVEVIARVAERHPRAESVLTTVAGRALALSSPNSTRITPGMIGKVLDMPEIKNGKRRVSQLCLSREGVMQSTHALPDEAETIGSEVFRHQFLFETPIDGYGSPAGYISLLREVCTNGAVAYVPAFRSIFKLGGDDEPQIIYSLHKALSGFSNESAFQALSQRFQKAAVTAPSVSEYGAFRGLLVQQMKESKQIVAVLDAIDRKLGSITDLYSVPAITDIDPKRAHNMPMRGAIRDIINIATEITTHYPAIIEDPNRIHAWIGSLIQETYDLEDVANHGDPTGDVEPRERYLTEALAA